MKPSTFGQRLREYRLRARKTQEQLADAIGVDFTYISKIEKGKAPPPARDRIEAAAKFLQLKEEEELELLRMAEKVPADVQQWVIDEPRAVTLYRKIQKAPPEEQDVLLQDLINEVERRLRESGDGDEPD